MVLADNHCPLVVVVVVLLVLVLLLVPMPVLLSLPVFGWARDATDSGSKFKEGAPRDSRANQTAIM